MSTTHPSAPACWRTYQPAREGEEALELCASCSDNDHRRAEVVPRRGRRGGRGARSPSRRDEVSPPRAARRPCARPRGRTRRRPRVGFPAFCADREPGGGEQHACARLPQRGLRLAVTRHDAVRTSPRRRLRARQVGYGSACVERSAHHKPAVEDEDAEIASCHTPADETAVRSAKECARRPQRYRAHPRHPGSAVIQAARRSAPGRRAARGSPFAGAEAARAHAGAIACDTARLD